jgi:hypothetical protein
VAAWLRLCCVASRGCSGLGRLTKTPPRPLYPPPQVGSVNNTFGITGVKEHCMFFKSIENASALRRRVSECFERAALPYVSRRKGCGGWAVLRNGSSTRTLLTTITLLAQVCPRHPN